MKPRRLFPLPQVRFECEHWHRQLVDTLQGLPDAMFAPGQIVATFVGIGAGHYRQHAQDIREWRQKEGI